MSKFHLSYPRDGGPVACDCKIGWDHDSEERAEGREDATNAGANGWTTELRRRMIDALVKHGSPRSDTPGTYGWIHSNWMDVSRAVKTGEIDYAATSWAEVDWHEFRGTFYEGDTRQVGIDVTVVMRDGATYVYRYAGTVGELIQAIVGDIGGRS